MSVLAVQHAAVELVFSAAQRRNDFPERRDGAKPVQSPKRWHYFNTEKLTHELGATVKRA